MTLHRIVVCIPARLDSSRLPRKLLESIGPQTIIEHVCDRVIDLCGRLQSRGVLERAGVTGVEGCVVTDAPEIEAKVRSKGLGVFRSLAPHDSGTSRIAEYLHQRLGRAEVHETLVVNVQGDEPFLKVADVVRLIEEFVVPPRGSEWASFAPEAVPVATLVYRNTSRRAFLDPSCVKVVRRQDGMALYFSRAPIPWPRQWLGTESLVGRCLDAGDAELDGEAKVSSGAWSFWQHLGIYVYRGSYLLDYPKNIRTQRAIPPCDEIEGLEQLAVLEEGKSIFTLEATAPGHGIDTVHDLQAARGAWAEWLETARSSQ